MSTLTFYGLFLCFSGIASVVFIGRKAKTALISGGTSGVVALYTGWLVGMGNEAAVWVGIFLSLTLFTIFSWRATKTLFKLFELIPLASPDLKGKGVAFLIISLMAVVSIFVFVLQVTAL